MANGQVLYDATGRAIGEFAVNPSENAFSVNPPSVGAPTNGSASAPPSTDEVIETTRGLQQAAEYVEAGQVVGGDTHLPFGPELTVQHDDEGEPMPFDVATVVDADGRIFRSFRIAEAVGAMPLLRFAHAAKSGVDSADMEGMAALYSMIQDCVEPADWDAFVEYAIQCKAEDDTLLAFVNRAMEIITARPRKRRGSSSATSASTSPRSRGSSSARVTPIPPGAIVPDEAAGLLPVSELTR